MVTREKCSTESSETLAGELSTSALALLAMLSEKEMTGYQIKKMVDNPELIYWRDSFGSIYPNLSKLTKMGLTEKNRRDFKGRKRIFYSITSLGRSVVESWLRKPATKKPVKVELLFKLRFAHSMGVDVLGDLIGEYRDYHLKSLADLYETLQIFDGSRDEDLQREVRRMTVDFWYRFTKTIVEWCDSTLDRLEEYDS
ncbi:MAG: hypothetical protein GF388_07355 [Candidatus Aegiribacteria sp.]|nr:hypothetical protein [Candidatus Aegiribacteria sp.]MBD3294947.1 hypothetical protein [Candidatus Fermentibacteria bacterium]